jgi:toxin ParE1/3/4
MNDKYNVIFSRYAENDLLEIIDYYYNNNTKYANNIFSNIEVKIKGLNVYPERGRIVPELEKQSIVDYRELIEDNYRIIYSIQNKEVTVHSIIDARRNFEEVLVKKLLQMYLKV